MTHKFTFPDGLKTEIKIKTQKKHGRCIYSKAWVRGSGEYNKCVNNTKKKNMEESLGYKAKESFFYIILFLFLLIFIGL